MNAVLWLALAAQELQDAATLDAHSRYFTSLAISRDGSRVAAGDSGGTVTVWSDALEKTTAIRAHDTSVRALCFSPDGRRIATAGFWDGTARLYDVESGKRIADLERREKGEIAAFRFSDDGRTLSWGFLHTQAVWVTFDLEAGKVVSEFTLPLRGGFVGVHGDRYIVRLFTRGTQFWRTGEARADSTIPGDAESAAWTPDGSSVLLLFRESGKTTLSMRSAADRKQQWEASWPAGVYILAVGEKVAYVANKDEILSVNVGDGRSAVFAKSTGAFRGALSPDGRRLYSIRGGEIAVWDVATAGKRNRALAESGHATAAVFSSDSKTLYSRGHDSRLLAWSLDQDPPRQDWESELHPMGAGLRTVSDVVLAGSTEGQWDVFDARGSRLGTVLDLSPDKSTAVYVDFWTREAEIASFPDRANRRKLPGHVHRAQLSARGTYALAFDVDLKTLIVYSAADGVEVHRLQLEMGAQGMMSPDEKRIASLYGSSVRIYDLADKKNWTLAIGTTCDLRFSPTSERLFGRSLEGDSVVWKLEDRSKLELKESTQEGKVPAVAFSADGALLAWAGEDLKIYRVEDAKRLQTIEARVDGISFSPDGRWVAGIERRKEAPQYENQGAIRLWRVVR